MSRLKFAKDMLLTASTCDCRKLPVGQWTVVGSSCLKQEISAMLLNAQFGFPVIYLLPGTQINTGHDFQGPVYAFLFD